MNAEPFLTRRFLLVGTGLCLTSILTACQTELVLAPIEEGYAVDVTNTSLPMVNAVRANKGLKPLFIDPYAVNAAKDQAIRMARLGKMSHDLGPDASFLDRMKRLEVNLPAAENIAVGQKTTDKAIDAWVRSKHHLENMLGDYRGLGVALAFQSTKNQRPFWSMCLSNAEKPLPSSVKIKAA